MNRLLIPLLLLAASGLVGQSVRDLKFPPLTFHPPRAVERQLSNGMTVFLLPDRELPMVSAFALIRTGAIYEPADKLGLASITGTVLRTGGTQALSPEELNEELEFLAASVESSIGDESGSASLWVLKRDLETGLRLFSQVLRTPAFRQDQIDLVKDQIRESIRRRNDFPAQIANREFAKLIYGRDHPLARTVELVHLDNINRQDLVQFHARYYQPNQMILGVSGDFEVEEMMSRLEHYLGDWKGAPVELPPVPTLEEPPPPSIHFIRKEINQTNLRIGHWGIRQTNPDFFAVTVLDSILGGGFSSRLFRQVRGNLGLAYSVSSHFGAGMRERGIFAVSLETEAGSTARAVEAVIGELRRLREEPVQAEELTVAKESVLNSFVFAFESPAQIANRQVRYRFFGLPDDYLQTYRDRVAAVTISDVQEVARKYLHPDRLVILAVGPEPVREALQELGPVQEILLE